MGGIEGSGDASTSSNLISTEEFPLICRTCLKKGHLVPIFCSIMHDNIQQVMKIDWLLKECAKLEVVDNDNLPKNICEICLMRIIEIYNFQRKCYLNNLTLVHVQNAVAIKQDDHQEIYFFDTSELLDHTYVKIEEPSASEGPHNVSESNGDIKSFGSTLHANRQSVIEPENTCIDIETDDDLVKKLDENNQESIDRVEDIDDLTSSDIEEVEIQNQNQIPNSSVSIQTMNKNTVSSGNLIDYVYICMHCSHAFTGFKELRAHQIEKQHPKKFRKRRKLTPNRKRTGAPSTREYNCKNCLKTFNTFKELRIHRKEARHPVNHSMCPCEVCGKVFKKGRLKLHMRSHTKEKPFKCNSCGLAFAIKVNLKRHMLVHTGEKRFVCENCGRRFTRSMTLLLHQQKHCEGSKSTASEGSKSTGSERSKLTASEGGKSSASEGSKSTASERNKLTASKGSKLAASEGSKSTADYTVPLCCSICHDFFKTPASLNIHMQRKHPSAMTEQNVVEKEETDSEGTFICVCDKCGNSFNSKSQLKEHRKCHHKKVQRHRPPCQCTVCGKLLSSKFTLATHMRLHTGEKPYVCTVCSKSFKQYTSYVCHLRIHSGAKPYKCNECDKTFTQKPHLLYHRRVHNGERPYSCEFCDKAFALKSNLTVHIRTHTGETPYHCNICDRGFYDSSSRNKHQKSH